MSSALRVARHDDAEIKARMIAVSRVSFIPTSREQFQVVPRAAVRYTHSSAAFTLRRGLGRDAPTAFLVVRSAGLQACTTADVKVCTTYKSKTLSRAFPVRRAVPS